MGLCKNHDHLYFDALCRTKKKETVLSLIIATHQTKINNGTKKDIARALENAYELFKYTAGSYDGGINAFSSQYTIGHEMGIWKNSELELTDLALKVAVGEVAIKDYFDIVFLNYIQPIDNTMYNLLFIITKYMMENNLSKISKNDLTSLFSFTSNSDKNDINAIFNLLVCTNYFIKNDANTIVAQFKVEDINACCNVEYHLKTESEVKMILQDNEKFASYLQKDRRSLDIISMFKEFNDLHSNTPVLKYIYTVNKESLSEEELGMILSEYIKRHKSIGIHLFAIDYCDVINGFDKKQILLLAEQPISYETEINKGIRIGHELKNGNKNICENDQNILDSSSSLVGFNKIFYGIPGCGKSYKVQSMLEYIDDFQGDARENGITHTIKPENIFRTTFYLDYTNSDLIGQIYPVVDDNGNVAYEPVPGPFTKALVQAYTHPEEMIYLVIEEVNRGNAAAIFGDLFQLLDRVKKKNDHQLVGESEYPISNEFIEGYLKKIINGKIKVDGNISKLDYLSNHNIIIPNNLTIFATMNTNDQNVFPLDTAFKRRWNLERISAKFEKDENGKYILPILNLCIPFTDWTWGNFASSVNLRMIENCKDGIITQDRNLGPFFANEEMLVEASDRYNPENKQKLIKFVNNVIDYLFLDVTKFDHDVLFEKNIKYNDVYEYFTETLHSDISSSKDAKRYLEIFAYNIEDDVFDSQES